MKADNYFTSNCRLLTTLCAMTSACTVYPKKYAVFALLCFVVVIHWLIFPYPSGLLHWHCGNLTIPPVTAKQPRWIWINTSCEFIMNDCITTTKQSTTKPCAYFLGYTVHWPQSSDYKYTVKSLPISLFKCFSLVLQLHLCIVLKPCSWSIDGRRCSNYIWVISNFIAY